MADVRFTDIEFDATGTEGGRTVTATLVFATSLLGIVALFAYDYAIDPGLFDFQQFDWPLLVGVTAVIVYGVVRSRCSSCSPPPSRSASPARVSGGRSTLARE